LTKPGSGREHDRASQQIRQVGESEGRSRRPAFTCGYALVRFLPGRQTGECFSLVGLLLIYL